MKINILRSILGSFVVACVLLTGCDLSDPDGASPSATEGTLQTDQPAQEYNEILGTWELEDSDNEMVYQLTFDDGSVSYVAFSTDTLDSVTGGGSYSIDADGNASISISLMGVTLENTYTVSVSGDTLSLSLVEGETAAEGGYSLAGTYTKSELAENPDAPGQDTGAEAEVTVPTDDADTTASSSGRDEVLASFLTDTVFLADTDTFLGNAYENEVAGSFVLSDSDRIEGTFYVSIAQSAAESANFYIEDNMIYFSNNDTGTYSNCTFEVTDTYFRIQQIETDATGEDLLSTIDGTWNAN